jgi:hypothetical protein
MANWTMTINDKAFRSAEVSVGLWSAVAQVMGPERVKTFDDLQPYVGPDQLAAWYAVLVADSSDDKDVMTHLKTAYAMPMVELVSMVTVE